VIPGLRSLRSLTRGYLCRPDSSGLVDADIALILLFGWRYQLVKCSISSYSQLVFSCWARP